MNTNEKFEREFETFLNDQTESSLEAIYRKLPLQEPEIALDNAVLASARQALTATSKFDTVSLSARRTRPIYARHRWVMALGSAAGVVLAAGLAWRVSTDTWNKSTTLPLPTAPQPAPASASTEEVVSVELKKEIPLPSSTAKETDKKQNTKEMSSQFAESKDQSSKKPASAPLMEGVISSDKNTEKHVVREYTSPALASEKTHSFSHPSASTMGRADAEIKTKADTSAALADMVEEPQAFPVQAAPSDEKNASTPEKDRFEAQTESAPSKLTPLVQPSPTPEKTVRAKGRSTIKRNELAESSAEMSTAAPSPAPPPASVSAGSSLISAKQAQKKENEAERQSFSDSTKIETHVREPKHWIAQIRKLLRERRTDEALDNLQAFRKRYPDYPLPPDLRKLVK